MRWQQAGNLLAAVLWMMTPLSDAAEPSTVEPIARFNATVAPALAAKCVACHRADNLKGGFDLTTREGMLKGG